jgi:manganese oxidase
MGSERDREGSNPAPRRYKVVALEVPIVFNADGDHDHNGLIFALGHNKDCLDHLREDFRNEASEWRKKPHPLVRPLVLRARAGETVEICFENHVRGRHVGIHLIADHYDVLTSDGAHVGANPSSLAGPPEGGSNERTYTWEYLREGVFPFHDAGDLSGGEEGTNVHGLFGALVIEPAGAAWSHPIEGTRLDQPNYGPDGYSRGDGLYMDVHPRGWDPKSEGQKASFSEPPPKYPPPDASFREFAVFFHDEVEFVPAHETLEPNPCPEETDGHDGRHRGCCCHRHRSDRHSHLGRHLGHHDHDGACGCRENDHRRCRRVDHGGRGRGAGRGHGARQGGGSEHEGPLPIMTISYRAEPMVNRERRLWRMIRERTLLRPVIGEEQHHSAWLFGEPATPVLRAYAGDPVRIRFVHAAVKETHVFHQHVYQWHADPGNRNSPIIDSVTVSPQTGHTIEFLYGAGSAQGAIGDAIFHCHLYPHFHEGMWGILRTFDRLQRNEDECGNVRLYPDGTPIRNLEPLPDREAPPDPMPDEPGFPFFIPGQFGQKSPIPPWPFKDVPWTPDLDYRPPHLVTAQERNHLNDCPKPGALFNLHPFPQNLNNCPERRDLAVVLAPVVYNGDGWHDPHGHLFVLAQEAEAAERGGALRPLVVRGHRCTVVETTLDNRLPATIPGTAFDPPIPPCDFFPTPLGECGLHVHLVKFDPLVSDGASVGWNYMTGPRVGKKMIYRWHVDEEFGTVFFHDHLFANFRQKHGLFGAFIAEPPGTRFVDPQDHGRDILAGLEAVILPPEDGCGERFTPFREFCLAVADFIPLFDGRGEPLNPPRQRGGHGDQGVMAVNYRCEPIIERGGDPAFWFLSGPHQYEVSDPPWVETRRCADVHHGDPSTDVFRAHAGDPVRVRLFQGSHEEQHSFQVHGMRWRQYSLDALPDVQRPDPGQPRSPWRNQQTIGISEAFTFTLDQHYARGDHLWKFSGADDLWLGCWGLIRVHERGGGGLPGLPLSADEEHEAACMGQPLAPPADAREMRRFRVVAERRPVVYRERDLLDPFGIVYRLAGYAAPGEPDLTDVDPANPTDPSNPDYPGSAYQRIEPLIIRCGRGEWVQVQLENRLPLGLEPEPFAPEVPVEDCDREVSSRVSMHADLLRYDVTTSDGANVGRNPLIQTVEPGGTRCYHWCADENVGAVLLQDMADFRNHRHHGAIGALVVEPAGAEVSPWHGPRATISNVPSSEGGTETREEMVLILQDGLRLFYHGNTAFPVPDEPDLEDDPAGDRPDVEDQGQKGFNYRSEATGRPWWLHVDAPATPVFEVPAEAKVWFRLVGGADKPRNYSFTIHDHTWITTHISEAGRRVGSVSGVTSGWTETFDITAAALAADYAYRTGMLKWALLQGLWGILRVTNGAAGPPVAQAGGAKAGLSLAQQSAEMPEERPSQRASSSRRAAKEVSSSRSK